MTGASAGRGLTVLVAGAGAREHALAWALARSPRCRQVLAAPGNGGTASLARNLPVAADDVRGIVRAAREHAADLVVIGPDAAVAAGLADACRAERIAVFGPGAEAGRIESSKRFAKRLMEQAGIPTAPWTSGGGRDRADLLSFITERGGRCVVKADGLALGKGVTVCDGVDEAIAALDACLRDHRFGAAGDTVVVEERLEGPEVSGFVATDGRHVRALSSACDYKRAHDGDRGPNTGGMGSYAPPAGLDRGVALDTAIDGVVRPALEALAAAGTPYTGCLYVSLMLTPAGPRVIEFNARFGDPETQVILPLLAEDLLELLHSAARGELEPGRAAVHPGAAVGVVVAAAGYPGEVRRGDEITGLDALDPDVLVFHAGTARDPATGRLLTSGGRVLTVVARGDSLEGARRVALDNAARVRFSGAWHRSDIALLPAAARVSG